MNNDDELLAFLIYKMETCLNDTFELADFAATIFMVNKLLCEVYIEKGLLDKTGLCKLNRILKVFKEMRVEAPILRLYEKNT